MLRNREFGRSQIYFEPNPIHLAYLRISKLLKLSLCLLITRNRELSDETAKTPDISRIY